MTVSFDGIDRTPFSIRTQKQTAKVFGQNHSTDIGKIEISAIKKLKAGLLADPMIVDHLRRLGYNV